MEANPTMGDTEDIPLRMAWTVYGHPVADATTYNSSYVVLSTVSTCNEWGAIYNHLPDVGTLAMADRAILLKSPSPTRIVAYSFFRYFAKPSWEDPHNAQGTTLTARLVMTPDRLRSVWWSLCAMCAMESVDNHVLGVQVFQKWSRQAPMIRIDVWLRYGAEVADVQARLQEAVQLTFAVAPRHQGPAPSHAAAHHAAPSRGDYGGARSYSGASSHRHHHAKKKTSSVKQ